MAPVSPTAIKRIWGGDGYRLFLSHKAEVKKKTGSLKEKLRLYGISAFVAHADIRPTRDWEKEIVRALHSMDALVALMTEHFHESNWTDQEVGFALGRRVPTIAVDLGSGPYGFLARIQALSTTWSDATEDIVKLLGRVLINCDCPVAPVCGFQRRRKTSTRASKSTTIRKPAVSLVARPLIAGDAQWTRGPPFGDPQQALSSSGTYCGVVPRRAARRACRPVWRAVRRASRRCIPAVAASAFDSIMIGAAEPTFFCDH